MKIQGKSIINYLIAKELPTIKIMLEVLYKPWPTEKGILKRMFINI